MSEPSSIEPELSTYRIFSRQQWARLRTGLPLPISANDLEALVSLNDTVSLEDVGDIYMPLVRLLQIHIAAARHLYEVTNVLLGSAAEKVPYVIGVAGSVAVGKSTTARILQHLLARTPSTPQVELVTTDGFLYPNKVLQERQIMQRKGFPESYDRRRLLQFMADIKSGLPRLSVPLYGHVNYDVLPDQVQLVDRPDILIIEGLNVLQRGSIRSGRIANRFVSDFFDFAIYVHADERHLKQWYIERFLKLRETAFRNKQSYFRRYGDLAVDEAISVAGGIWDEINGINLKANIEPTRQRADLILEKGQGHELERVCVRKL